MCPTKASVENAEAARRGTVLVWTEAVLPGSETFIRNQFDYVKSFAKVLVGTYRVFSPVSRSNDLALFGPGRRGGMARELLHVTGYSRQLANLVGEVKPDVIHAHFLPNGWRVLRVAQKLRVPLVVTAHGHDVTGWPRIGGLRGVLFRRRARSVLKNSTMIIAVSRFIRKRVIDLGADPRKVIVHHIGIPIRPEVQRNGADFWDVIFVGRFVEKKGVLDFIHVLDVVAQERPVNALLIGDGPLLVQAKQLASSSKASLSFAGALSPEDVQVELGRSRIFMGPSKTGPDGDSEGFGMVFLEAAAAGLPVVATRHGGVPEAVDDGVTGFLSAEGDIGNLATHVLRLLEDQDLAVSMGRRGRQRVIDNYDIAKQTRILEEHYLSIIDRAS